jgi:AraC-like DNA-binding protein
MPLRTPDSTRGYVYRRRAYFGEGRFPIVVQKDVLHAQPVAEHRHEFSELVVVTGGSCVHVCGDNRWPIRQGDVFVLRDSRLHGYEQPEGLHITNVLFEPGRLRMPLHDVAGVAGYHALFALEPSYRERRGFAGRLRLSTRQLLRVRQLVDELAVELAVQAPGWRFGATARFMQLVLHLSRCYESSPPAAPAALLLRLAKAVGHLERNFAEPLTVEGLGRVAGMSRRHFQRLFREAMGSSPIDYLLRLRVRKAAESLAAGSAASVASAAYAVGFEDPNYFAKAFKRQMGVTPREHGRRSSGA